MIVSDGPYPLLYQKCLAQLDGLLSQPRVVIPWNALFDFSEKQFPNAILDLRIPSVIKPEQIPTYVRDFQSASTPAAPPTDKSNTLFVHIDPLDARKYSPTERVADFAQRIVYCRSTNPTATLIDIPLLRRNVPGSVTRSEPDQILLAYRTLVRALGNSVFRREIPLGASAGRHAFLFSRDARGRSFSGTMARTMRRPPSISRSAIHRVRWTSLETSARCPSIPPHI